MVCMQALLVGLPAGRRRCYRGGVGGGRMGVGLLDSTAEMDRELEKMRSGWGLETGVGAASGSLSSCATADFQFCAAYVSVVSMCSKPPLSFSGGSQPV